MIIGFLSFLLKFEKTLRLPFGQKVILNLPTSSKATTTEKESERESLASINSIQSINACMYNILAGRGFIKVGFFQFGYLEFILNYLPMWHGQQPSVWFSLSHMSFFQLTWGRKFSICFTSKVVAMSQSLLIVVQK